MCRNLLLERADEDGYDYVTLLDGDEILLSGEYSKVREEVLSQGLDAAYCRCHEYWKWPDVRMLSPVEYVPVMQRCGLRYTRRTVYSVRTDRSRRVIYDQDSPGKTLQTADEADKEITISSNFSAYFLDGGDYNFVTPKGDKVLQSNTVFIGRYADRKTKVRLQNRFILRNRTAVFAFKFIQQK